MGVLEEIQSDLKQIKHMLVEIKDTLRRSNSYHEADVKCLKDEIDDIYKKLEGDA